MPEEVKDVAMADIMESFNQASTGGEEEILRIASNYALQLQPEQLRTIMMLKMLAISPKTKHGLKIEIEEFIKQYLDLKHYHESGMFIMRVIDSLAIKKFVTTETAKVNVMK